MSRIQQNPQLFKSTNDFFQFMGEQGVLNKKGKSATELHEGICFGITTYWCKYMLKGIRDILTKPDYRLGETIQGCYNIASGASLDECKQKIWDNADLAGVKKISGKQIKVALGIIALDKGSYLCSNGAHVIGFDTSGGKYYYYDCDENGGGGLFLYDNKQDWQTKVLEAYDDDDTWNCWKMSLKA